MTTAIVPGSISAIAQASGASLAETFLSVDVVIIVDTSGSMDQTDSRSGKSRYEVACDELRKLQASLPGKIAVISFSHDVQFCPAGVAMYFGGGTDLTRALEFVKVADVPGMQFILISDGQPDEAGSALRVARTFENKISVIYVGPEDQPSGRDFLQRLAAATGGKAITADRAKELAASVQFLLKG
jgi:hypothetical protein